MSTHIVLKDIREGKSQFHWRLELIVNLRFHYHAGMNAWLPCACAHTHICMHARMHTYIHTYIPWIHKFVIATIGCGISHKDAQHTDKYSDNKTK
jgi:hypothetical protein